MAKAERLDENSLKALLSEEIRASITYLDSDLSERRTRAIEYYNGTMNDTPPEANRSRVVSRDVADTISWMLPGIIRVFTASDRMAEYEPAGIGDDAFAEQATDYCNFIFWKDNPGYRILWDATHDSLLQGNGIIKHWWDESARSTFSYHTGLTAEQIALLLEDGGEVVAQAPGAPQSVIDPQTGQPVNVPTFTVKVKRTDKQGRVKIRCIEPENFLIDSQATCIEDARFVAHRDEVSRSDLIEMGFSRSVVDELPIYSQSGLQSERLARDDDYDEIGFTGHASTELVELYECYIKADMDGDGVAETIRAYYAGAGGAGSLLDWDEFDDDLPFSDIPCEPVPHRWDARSIADETMDMQQIRTVLSRQMLNNLYWVNNPLTQGEAGSVLNPEMLQSPVFGGHIMLKQGAQPIAPVPIPFVADKALMGLEHFERVIEKRTGVSRATMSLDPDTLQNQTATANQNQRDAAYSQIELIARNQAELGWKRVFKMILLLVVKHQDRPRIIRLRDKPVEMDPRFWDSAMDVTINVGLGTGSRDRDMAMLNNILQTQTAMSQQLAATGFGPEAVMMLPKIIKTATKLAESAGIRNPDGYYPEIDDAKAAQMAEQAAQPKPDPKVQAEMQKAQMQMQADQMKAQNDLQIAREKMAAEMQIKREQMAGEMQLKQQQLAAELQLKERLAMHEMQMKREVGFYSADTRAGSMRSSGVHMGGEPG